jgi:serine/threonine-protein kinase
MADPFGLIADEFVEAFRQGKHPSVEEFARRYPEHADEIRDMLPALVMMERAKSDDTSGDHGQAKAAATAPLRQLGDYQILREVGRGGMGVVYEAQQLSLGRHVAIKVLPSHALLDPRQLHRFQREARSAARLHHTNIVPVFGVGEQDGLHYYVMQFIKGLGLDVVLDELRRLRQQRGRPTSTRDDAPNDGEGGPGHPTNTTRDVSAVDVARSLLSGALRQPEPAKTLATTPGGAAARADRCGATPVRAADTSAVIYLPGQTEVSTLAESSRQYWQSVARVGMQVADALAHAASQGVLHRDIKPSNLLLDDTGNVWVTDFGLAKADTDGDNLTHTGDIVGTLRYIAPERFNGQGDLRSDVYSLGLTLYELLTLRPAFHEADRNKLVKQVMHDEPVRPRKLNPAVPRDLETVVLKAIARDPAHRYQTPAAMADDLKRFVEDRPVRARRISEAEKFWRWCRRNRALSGALAMVVLLFCVAFVGIAYNYHKAEAAREEEARQRQDAVAARDAARAAHALEAEQRQRAEVNFGKARDAVDDYFTQVSESQLLRVPGMQPLRRELLQSALLFYQDFLKQRGDDPAVQAGLASAYLRVGRIRSELGEAVDARQAYLQARDLYARLVAADPENVELQHGLAQSYYHLPFGGTWTDPSAKAVERRRANLEKAIAIWSNLVRPEQPRFQRDLAYAYNALANDYNKAGKVAEGQAAHQQALTIRERLVRLSPNDPMARRDLGITLNNIAEMLAWAGRPQDALALYLRAAEHASAAFQQAPQVPIYGRFVAITARNVALAHDHLGNKADAAQWFPKAIAAWRRLATENPAMPAFQSNLVMDYRNLGRVQRELGQEAESVRSLRLAREVVELLPKEGPEDLFHLACVHSDCAALLNEGMTGLTSEERAEQQRDIRLALEALQKAVAAGFRDAERIRKTPQLTLLRERDELGALLANLAAAAKAEANAPHLPPVGPAAAPKDKWLRADLAAGQHAVGVLQFTMHRTDEAAKALNQALALREALVAEDPNNLSYQADLAATHLALGDVFWQAGRLAEGMAECRRGSQLLEAVTRADPRDERFANQVRRAEQALASDYAQCGLWNEAAHLSARWLEREKLAPMSAGCYDAALLRLLAGDNTGYRRLTASMLKVSDSDGNTIELIRCCTLSPDAAIDSARLLQRAFEQRPWPNHDKAWVAYNLGAACYRAGRYEQAAAPETGLANHPFVEAKLVLAMAQHRLGRKDEARRLLREADAWYEAMLQKALAGTDLQLPVPSWTTVAAFEVLRREAAELIDGGTFPVHPLMRAHRARAYLALGDQEKAKAELQAAEKP